MDDSDLMDSVTKTDLREALAAYPTRDEMRELMREEGERSRRHFDVVAESLRDDIRLIAEGLVALSQGVDSLTATTKVGFAAVDQRLMRLEARQS
jgi:hypothetical protein